MPPKPRPRPRPRVAARPPVATTSTAAESSHTSPAKAAAQKAPLLSEDDLFIRNKGRSLRKMEQRVAVVGVVKASSPAVESDYTDDEATPTRRKKQIKQHTQPKWAKRGGIKSIFHGASDSDSSLLSDGDGDGSPSQRNRRRRRNQGSQSGTPRGKQLRSRSKSLTPPPELTEMEKLRTQMAIEKVLPSLSRQSNTIVLEDDNDHDDDEKDDKLDEQDKYLDPALQQIVRKVQAQTHKDRSNIAESSNGPSMVTVHIKWEPHPEDAAAIGKATQSWTFTVNRNDSFKHLAMQLSQKALVNLDDLVLMRDGKRVYTTVTAAGLGLWNYLELQACTQATFEALRAIRDFRSPTPVAQTEGTMQHGLFAHAHNREGSVHPSEASATAADHDSEEKFRLILRAPGLQDVALSVRPSTTCAKIVQAYLRVLGAQQGVKLTPRKSHKVRLSVDGEKQDPDTPVADCDLEDGDLVDVVGLMVT